MLCFVPRALFLYMLYLQFLEQHFPPRQAIFWSVTKQTWSVLKNEILWICMSAFSMGNSDISEGTSCFIRFFKQKSKHSGKVYMYKFVIHEEPLTLSFITYTQLTLHQLINTFLYGKSILIKFWKLNWYSSNDLRR